MKSAAEILAIIHPEQLFTGDKDTASKEYRKLCSQWHTDRNPDADPAVIAHINVLYDHAVAKLDKGEWEIPGELLIETTDGKTFKFKYKSKRENDVGVTYVSDNFVMFFVTKDNADLYAIAKKQISGLRYANDKMREEMEKFLPKIHAEHETTDHYIMVMKKTPDVFLLRDVLDFFDGKMDPKHAAWIISRLYNICCYLKYAGIVHAGISIDSVFISPQHHSAILMGNWWFSAKAESKMIALPAFTAKMINPDIITEKKAISKIDLEMVKAVGRLLLGDAHGSKLLMDKTIPASLITWLRTSTKGDAFADYDTWQNTVLIESFGKRKFVKLEVDANKIYTN